MACRSNARTARPTSPCGAPCPTSSWSSTSGRRWRRSSTSATTPCWLPGSGPSPSDVGGPGPGAAHERLAALEGDWMGEEVLAPSPWDPEGGAARGRYRFGTAIDGLYLLGDYQQERGSGVTSGATP